LQKSDWDFDTLLGIIQGMLDHAEDVRLAALAGTPSCAQAATATRIPPSGKPCSIWPKKGGFRGHTIPCFFDSSEITDRYHAAGGWSFLENV
jgi:hypothetical protein